MDIDRPNYKELIMIKPSFYFRIVASKSTYYIEIKPIKEKEHKN